MIYTLIGVGSTFFALLPFLLILFKLVKTREKKTYAIGVLLFLIALVVVVAIITYALYSIQTDTLIGEGIVIGGYLIVFLWMFLIRRYKFRKRYRDELVENDEDDYEDDSYELFEDEKTMVLSRPEFAKTMPLSAETGSDDGNQLEDITNHGFFDDPEKFIEEDVYEKQEASMEYTGDEEADIEEKEELKEDNNAGSDNYAFPMEDSVLERDDQLEEGMPSESDSDFVENFFESEQEAPEEIIITEDKSEEDFLENLFMGDTSLDMSTAEIPKVEEEPTTIIQENIDDGSFLENLFGNEEAPNVTKKEMEEESEDFLDDLFKNVTMNAENEMEEKTFNNGETPTVFPEEDSILEKEEEMSEPVPHKNLGDEEIDDLTNLFK